MIGERSNEDDLQKLIARLEAGNPQLRLDREVVGKMFDYGARAVAAEARAAALQTAIGVYREHVHEFCAARSPQSPSHRPDLCVLPNEHDGDHFFDSAAAAVGAVPETRDETRCAECDGTGTVYLDSDGDECAEPDSVREIACPYCGPVPETPEKPRKEQP